MNKHILCIGGLGNQMFQYAFYVWMRTQTKCVLDYSVFKQTKIHNGFELPDVFELTPDKDKYATSHKKLLRFALKWPHFPIIKDPYLYEPRLETHFGLYYVGYWQSEKWFVPVKEQVLACFQFKNISEKNRTEAAKMQNCQSVSIHIRRGDYVDNSIYENCATLDYYRKAFAYLKKQLHGMTLWVFSNDIDWCRANLSEFIDDNTTFVSWNSGTSSYQDMYLMSQCKHNIIANSSFSWWGAYLNRNPAKIVIAPAKWYNTAQYGFQDIVPEDWIKL